LVIVITSLVGRRVSRAQASGVRLEPDGYDQPGDDLDDADGHAAPPLSETFLCYRRS
jgi:hypothetical protein